MWAYLGEEGRLRLGVSDSNLGLKIGGGCRGEYGFGNLRCGC
jgi:hypothetical protein